MALIACSECGKEISDQASTCPHCGCPRLATRVARGSGGSRLSSGYAFRALVGLAVAFVLAVALNPSEERHKEVIKRAFAADGPLIGAIAGQLTSMSVQYQSRVIYSYTTLNGKLASWGALGYVHATSSEN